MNLTLLVKLQPTVTQTTALRVTMERFNAACNAIAEVAFREHSANKFLLQRLTYYDVRERFGLSAQHTVRAIGKVSDAYKRDKNIQPFFNASGAIAYDQRIMAWKGIDRVSLTTLTGREIIPVVMDAYHAPRLNRKRGQADLILRDGIFYLAVVVDVDEPPVIDPSDWLGVDLGIVSLATDSDGNRYTGKQVLGLRARYTHLRTKLQRKGTKSAKRLLQKRRRKESRMQRDVNHVVSKQLVARAQGTGRGIALENLQGIRDRITVRRAQRRVHHSWAFFQLRSFVSYKAKIVGVPVALIDPRNTSRECLVCGHIAKENRRTQSSFLCQKCGYAAHADENAARIIAGRAACHAAIRLELGHRASVQGQAPRL